MSSYKALVDVTGIFNDWSLSLQKNPVPLLQLPAGGYHAEAVIDIAADNKLFLQWFAKGNAGVAWTFAISVAPIDNSGNVGDPKTWSDKGTLPAESQVGINGVLLTTNMKGAA